MSKKRRVVILVINVLLLISLAVTAIRGGSLSHLLQSQRAAERFRGESDTRFAQVSCFFPGGAGIYYNAIGGFRQSMEAKLLEASLEAPENGSLWMDAYSLTGTVTVQGFRGSYTASALGVGGDYFRFHPLVLRSGSYIFEDDPNQDKVVLDEALAWQLFGSYDVAGMDVTIAGVPYIVAGVVEREEDFASEMAYQENAGIFVPYQVLAERDQAVFSSYEVVLPDPIPDFAEKIVSEGIQAGSVEVVQNTGRFGLSKLWSMLTQFGARSMRSDGMSYPYWENAARVVEDHLALLLVCGALLALFPLVCLAYIAVKLLLKLKGKRKKAADWLDDQREKLTQAMRNNRRI